MKRVTVALLLIAACGEGVPLLEPIIDVPPIDSDAYPYGGVDELLVSVARAGEDVSLQEALISAGQSLLLSEIPFGEELVVHLSGRSSGIEIAYGRTCKVTVTADEQPPDDEPHLYLSRIVKWGISAAPSEPGRVGGHGYALPRGSAVLLGGNGGITSVERFDPQTGSFRLLSIQLTPRRDSVLAPFADGRALIVGGVDGDDNPVATVEVVDPRPGIAPAARRDEQEGPSLRYHAAATLVDDSVVVTGGIIPPGGQSGGATPAAWSFRFGAGNILEPALQLDATMHFARARHSMTRLGDELGADVLIVGGLGDTGMAVKEAELFRPLRESFELVAGATLTHARWGHAAVRLPGGFVLIVGGLQPPVSDPRPVAALELYDPIQGQFSSAGTLPAGAGLTDLTITELPDGRSLLAGGLDINGQPVATVLIARLDPVDGQVDVSATDSLAVPRAAHSAVRLCDGTILISGGTDAPGQDTERYNPPPEGRR
ncbi:MAG: kelch motif-containing protein [Proteobacteria bacterium]|nr:kelch motif-containing protein [Pseudomonadota bacterium]